MRRYLPLTFILVVIVVGHGCRDERAVKLAREAADRQAEQNDRLAEMARASTEANRETARLQRDVQANQAEVHRQHAALDAERRETAAQRRTESVMAPAVQNLGALLLAALAFLFCLSLLFGLGHEQDAEKTAAVNELLVEELANNESPSLPSADTSRVGSEPRVPSIGQEPK